jgi:hypothetical protein
MTQNEIKHNAMPCQRKSHLFSTCFAMNYGLLGGMKELIKIHNQGSELRADSRAVAQLFGVQHESLRKLIDEHASSLEQLGHTCDMPMFCLWYSASPPNHGQIKGLLL